MSMKFEQQDRMTNIGPPKSAPSPQHGQRAAKPADPSADKLKPVRSFQPRPAH